jgi:hypothetical protein
MPHLRRRVNVAMVLRRAMAAVPVVRVVRAAVAAHTSAVRVVPVVDRVVPACAADPEWKAAPE